MPIAARVGIVSWNTADLLDRCLASLPAATDGLDVDVVVVDNNSSDDSVAVARRHPGVTVLANPDNEGYAKAMNQALAADTGRTAQPMVLIALNPDTEAPPGSLATLCQLVLDDPTVGLVVPRLVNPDGTVQHSVYRFPSPGVTAVASLVPVRWQRGRLADRFWLEGSAGHAEPVDIDWAIGAVHAIRAAALGSAPPYNERWFMYVEDLDLCWRLASGGWRRRFEPSVSVLHVGNAAGSIAWGAGRIARWLQATYDWYQLRHGPWATRGWAAVNVVGTLARMAPAAVRSARGKPLAGWQEDLPRALPHHLRAVTGRLPSPTPGPG